MNQISVLIFKPGTTLCHPLWSWFIVDLFLFLNSEWIRSVNREAKYGCMVMQAVGNGFMNARFSTTKAYRNQIDLRIFASIDIIFLWTAKRQFWCTLCMCNMKLLLPALSHICRSDLLVYLWLCGRYVRDSINSIWIGLNWNSFFNSDYEFGNVLR